jgi:hypothetical protein
MRRPLVCTLLAFVVTSCSAFGADRTSELIPLLPRDSNALFVIHVAEILASPRAVKEGWSDQQAEKFLHGESSVPPWVETMVTGSLVRPGGPSGPEDVWSAALMAVPADATLEVLTGEEAASIETLGASRAVQGRGDSLYLDVKPGVLGAFTPAHRQDAARWSRQMAAGGTPQISEYLIQASALPGHIVLAMDLQDLLDPNRIRHRLGGEEAFLTAPQLVERVSKQLASMTGVSFTITIGDELASTVTIDFASPPTESPELYRGLFVSMLNEMGAGIDEFETARGSISNTQLKLDANLSEESVRRILSLIVPPAPHPQVAPVAATAPALPPKGNVTIQPPRPGTLTPLSPEAATRRYYMAVAKMIDDLKVANRNATSYERTAMWHDNFARRITDLPIQGVSKEVVAFGLSIADKFRALAASLRGQAVQVAAAGETYSFSYSYDPGWVQWGWWGNVGYRAPTTSYTSNLSEVRTRQAQAVEAGSGVRTQIWTQIDNERGAMEVQLKRQLGDNFLSPRWGR